MDQLPVHQTTASIAETPTNPKFPEITESAWSAFPPEDLNKIQPVMAELAQTPIYKVSKLRQLVSQLSDLHIQELAEWVKHLERTIHAGDEAAYRTLVAESQMALTRN